MPPATTEGLHRLACHVISPARKARTGRIGLRVVEGNGFGTPPFDDGTRILVRGDQLIVEPSGDAIRITTLQAAAEFVGVELSLDPGVGEDIPPLEADVDLAVDAAASLELGAWFAFGHEVLGGLDPAIVVGEEQLWPEHFDLAVVVETHGQRVNVGFSAGDASCDEPYVYVGPHDLSLLGGDFWNAPFGAYRRRSELDGSHDAALRFIHRGLELG